MKLKSIIIFLCTILTITAAERKKPQTLLETLPSDIKGELLPFLKSADLSIHNWWIGQIMQGHELPVKQFELTAQERVVGIYSLANILIVHEGSKLIFKNLEPLG